MGIYQLPKEVRRRWSALGRPEKLQSFGPHQAGLLCDGESALQTWEELRTAFPSSGLWPVLLSPEVEGFGVTGRSVKSRILAAVKLDLESWLVSRGAWSGKGEVGQSPSDVPLVIEGEAGRIRSAVALTVLALSQAWEAPAALGLGGCDDCPENVVHVALLRCWEERYGAVLLGVGQDFVEIQVERPPQAPDSQLAREQLSYCPGLSCSVDSLANWLVQRPRWLFWWD